MTLKEGLEILHEETIKVFNDDPMSIPCIETSDAEKLCKHPVVSVQMLTYNHEPFIRQAIEGVMMQRTDFEFELVIGEDCSQDKTREICFEYQKKYPDKIRVLWWHENMRTVKHPAGGNERRTTARCRGEFIAFCEGDDYWTEPFKLQKQVDVMRRFPSLSLCCHQFKVLKDEKCSIWNVERLQKLTERSGTSCGFEFTKDDFFNPGIFAQTATVLIRRSKCDWIFYYTLKKRCDISLFYSCLKDYNGYFINHTMSVYRITTTGMWQGKTEYDRAIWHLGIVKALYDADPCMTTRGMFNAAKHRVRMSRFPLIGVIRFYKFCRKVLSALKRSLMALIFNNYCA